MKSNLRNRASALAVTAVLGAAMLAPHAQADTVDTTTGWNGTSSISSWGWTNTATYGQTFTTAANQSGINSFTVYIKASTVSPAVNYQAFIYGWDGTKITGSALYSSAALVAPTNTAAFTPLTFTTTGTALSGSTTYVLFLTTSNQSNSGGYSSQWGAMSNNPYAGGQFVFMNNGSNFGQLSTTNWTTSFSQYDLAMMLDLVGLAKIDGGQAYYLSSALGTTFSPDFAGGTLRIDQAATTYSQAFTATNSSANTLDLNGNTMTISGGIDNATTGGKLIITSNVAGGTLNLSGHIGTSGNVFGTITNNRTLHVLNGGSIWASGITNNAGATITVDAGGAINDALNNSGTVSNSGTYTADLNNTGAAAVVTNTATGVWNGNILTNSGGAIVNNLGTWNGTTNNSATGTINAQGTLNGAVTNAGAFNLTGNLAAGGNAFSNAATGILTVGVNAYTGLGAVSNAAGGQIRVGTSTVNGSIAAASMSNSGALVMQNGRPGDAVTLTGAYTGVAGSTISVDANLASNLNQADRVTAASTSGTSTISIANSAATKGYFANPIVLVSATSGTGTFTLATDAQTTAAMANNGIVKYSFGKIGTTNNWGISSSLDGSVASSLASDTAALVSTINSGFLSTADETSGARFGSGKLSSHMWARAVNGGNSVETTSVSSEAGSSPATTRQRIGFNGIQGGIDSSIHFEHVALRFGATVGWLESRSKQQHGDARTGFKIPLYGMYGGLSGNGVSLDLQTIHTQLDITPDAALSTSTVRGQADTWQARLSFPHQKGNYTCEPFLTYASSSISVKDLALNGGIGTLSMANMDGTVASAGVRLSAVQKWHDGEVLPFISLAVANEDGDMPMTTFAPTGGAGNVTLTSTRMGSYAQISSGVTFRFAKGAEAYAKADARLGDTVNGMSAVAGVRIGF